MDPSRRLQRGMGASHGRGTDFRKDSPFALPGGTGFGNIYRQNSKFRRRKLENILKGLIERERERERRKYGRVSTPH